MAAMRAIMKAMVLSDQIITSFNYHNSSPPRNYLLIYYCIFSNKSQINDQYITKNGLK